MSRFRSLIVALCALLAVGATLVVSSPASAFCGFYVSGADASLFADATRVVLMREGTRTVLSMQNHYAGPTEDFALVVPVPQVLQAENVVTLANDVFDRVDQMGAPRLVEYWEQDPCYEPRRYAEEEGMMAIPSMEMPSAPGGGFVEIEAQFEVGEYDIVVLSSNDATTLDAWLRDNSYNIPEGAGPLLRPYIEGGMFFFVARVSAERVTFDAEGQAMLSPLRFHYDTDQFALPVRLGLINARGAQDLIVNILAPGQRYEMANMPNVTIPTNIEVAESVEETFGAFYAALFDRTVEQNPGAVVTEYAWDASTCDPCPGATLTRSDFLTLGGDALPTRRDSGFVLTRLHARYTAEQLTDDLVFQAAAPIVGGREVHGANGELEHGSNPASTNNFQGRYIIRHRWDGEVACDEPNYGRWGGPPAGEDASPSTAQDTAFAPRDAVELASAVYQNIPEIGVVAASSPPESTPPPESAGTSSEEDEREEGAETGGRGFCAVAPTAGCPWAPGVFGLGLSAWRVRSRREDTNHG